MEKFDAEIFIEGLEGEGLEADGKGIEEATDDGNQQTGDK